MYGANYYGQSYYGASASSSLAAVFKTVTLLYNILAVSVQQTLTLLYTIAANQTGREVYGQKVLYPTLANAASKSDPTQQFDS